MQAKHEEVGNTCFVSKREKLLCPLPLCLSGLLLLQCNPTRFQAIKSSKEDEFRQWLHCRESEEVNHSRGGLAKADGFRVQKGTALHWAVYHGSYPIAKMLIDRGAGAVLLSCRHFRM